jgi:hypothetical protein
MVLNGFERRIHGAVAVGLAMRHSKEMNGNIVSDLVEKISSGMPKIKVERKE